MATQPPSSEAHAAACCVIDAICEMPGVPEQLAQLAARPPPHRRVLQKHCQSAVVELFGCSRAVDRLLMQATCVGRP
jgi:hypothetical protein